MKVEQGTPLGEERERERERAIEKGHDSESGSIRS